MQSKEEKTPYSYEMFCEDVGMGREIEFHALGTSFFLGRTTETDLMELEIENTDQREIVFTGTLEELMEFPFFGKYRLKDDFSIFEIDCILLNPYGQAAEDCYENQCDLR